MMDKCELGTHSPSAVIDSIIDQEALTCKYYEVEQIDGLETKGYEMCALQINIHSVSAKLDDLRNLISTLYEKKIIVDFIMLCETFLNDSNMQLCQIDGYNLVCKNRINGKRGGVAIYVRDNLIYKLRPDLVVNIDNELESLFIEVKHRHSSVIVGEIYRIPNSNVKLSIERFHTIVNKLRGMNHDVILGTDQNFDLMKYNMNNNIKDFLDGFISAGFLPTISIPTRITHNSSTLIDNIYLKGFQYFTHSSAVLNYDISDHLPVISFMGKPSCKASTEPKFIEHRSWTPDTIANIIHDMQSKDWTCLESTTINQAYDIFSDNLQGCIDEYAPVRVVRIPSKHIKRDPWMTKGLLKSVKNKHKLFAKCKGKAKDHPSYKRYHVYKSVFDKIKRKAKLLYVNNTILLHRNNMRKTWEFVNSQIGRTRNKKSCVDLLTSDKAEITEHKDIAESFCQYFAGVGKKQSEEIEHSNKKAEEYFAGINEANSIYLQPTDALEIIEVVSTLKTKNSCGHDNLSSKALKQIIHGIAQPLSVLINRTLSEGTYPAALKVAKVIPVYKKGEHDQLNNYRPISLLSTFSKIFEKIIFNRLYKFLENHDIIDPLQFGFRPKHSTIDAISLLVKDILQSLDKKDYTIGVFCDLSKAFDTINHKILLYKLNRYGIRGNALNLIASYLHDRKQYVVNGKMSSDIVDIPAFGVPQGSILGPLLFLLYINDLQKSIQTCKHILYADDTTLYLTGPDPRVLVESLNYDLSSLATWFKANKLKLNVQKTTHIIFSNNYVNQIFEIKMDGQNIMQVSNTKFLGIYLEGSMKWEYHTKYVVKKLVSGLYAMNSLKHFMPTYILTTLYHALIHPHLTYGCMLWGNSYKKYLQKIQVLQKKAMRIICHAKYNASASPLFKDKNILKLDDLYKLHTCQFMYRLYTQTLPRPLVGMLTQNIDVHNRLTRHRNDFVHTMSRNNIVQRSFLVEGPKLWNCLPDVVKNLSYKQFCKRVKKDILDSY